jgi:hypothetical protein
VSRKIAPVVAALALSCLIAVAVAGARSAIPPTGKWNGTIGLVPAYSKYRPSAKVVIGAGGAATGIFNGLTGATHDPAGMTTSCTIRYRFLKQTGSWFYYLQHGAVKVASRGYVANAPCVYSGDNALRVTKVAARRLRADFGTYSQDPGAPTTFDFAGATGQAERGYLRAG